VFSLKTLFADKELSEMFSESEDAYFMNVIGEGNWAQFVDTKGLIETYFDS
jgi:hypothetical protein